MSLTKEQQESLLTASKPLIRWMNENCHPHVTAIVDCINVELVEGICRTGTEEFLKDADPCDGCNKGPVDCPGRVPGLSDAEQPCRQG